MRNKRRRWISHVWQHIQLSKGSRLQYNLHCVDATKTKTNNNIFSDYKQNLTNLNILLFHIFHRLTTKIMLTIPLRAVHSWSLQGPQERVMWVDTQVQPPTFDFWPCYLVYWVKLLWKRADFKNQPVLKGSKLRSKSKVKKGKLKKHFIFSLKTKEWNFRENAVHCTWFPIYAPSS